MKYRKIRATIKNVLLLRGRKSIKNGVRLEKHIAGIPAPKDGWKANKWYRIVARL